jgi:hypothetical protein
MCDVLRFSIAGDKKGLILVFIVLTLHLEMQNLLHSNSLNFNCCVKNNFQKV